MGTFSYSGGWWQKQPSFISIPFFMAASEIDPIILPLNAMECTLPGRIWLLESEPVNKVSEGLTI